MTPTPNTNFTSISTGNMGFLSDQLSKGENLQIAAICLGSGLIVMLIFFVVCKIRISRQQKKAAEERKIRAAEKHRAGNGGIENKMDDIQNKNGRKNRPFPRSKQRVGDIGRSDNGGTNHKGGDGRNLQQNAESSRKGLHNINQSSDPSNGKRESQRVMQRKISSHNNDIEEIPLTPMD